MKKKILNVLSILFGLLLINGGLNKFFNYMPVPQDLPAELMKDTMALMEISWLMPLVAIAEIVGGLLVLIPRTRALGALVLFPIMIGILLIHLIVAKDGLAIVLVIWGIFLWIIIDSWNKYLALVQK